MVDSMLKDRHQEEFHRTRTGHVSAGANSEPSGLFVSAHPSACAVVMKKRKKNKQEGEYSCEVAVRLMTGEAVTPHMCKYVNPK